ncbi:DUF1330 domain-containing protein [Novosphingobium sp. FSY-8]|uniref:DUF1330 domain-containing protein n=1 Tax=Novosphingobium ovatum TaxID=1908523 RepID=A0ABW9XBU8_9SPHN|nr:DUF1330 domain-containing protein [Novosphingobium ovatum]NBC35970.1 DUF1330 domain-containing protein [Novosphingobium ovatum]
MAAYIIATVRIDDPAKFGPYAKAAAEVAASMGGEYIIRGKVLEVFEGEALENEVIVVIRFSDADTARAYIASDGYQNAKAMRIGAGVVNSRLVDIP